MISSVWLSKSGYLVSWSMLEELSILLDKMFAAFTARGAYVTDKAATALEDIKHDSMLERTKADKQNVLTGLTPVLVSSGTATAMLVEKLDYDCSTQVQASQQLM